MADRCSSRRRLKPWLERILNSRECPGIEWYNKEDNSFLIYWKHRKDPSWSPQDGEIFTAWGKFTGLFDKTPNPNGKDWKQNFRNALCKAKDIQELTPKPIIKNYTTPYKVFQFTDCDQGPFVNVKIVSNNNKMTCKDNRVLNSHLQLEQSQCYQYPNTLVPSCESENDINTVGDLLPSAQPTFSSRADNVPTFVKEMCKIKQNFYPMRHVNQSHMLHPNMAFSDDFSNALTCSGDRQMQCHDEDSFIGDFTLDTDQEMVPAVSECQMAYAMNVEVCYHNTCALSQDICNQGVALFHGMQWEGLKYSEEFYGGQDLEECHLPYYEEIKTEDGKPRKDVKDILEHMNRGFTLEYSNGDIYAKRYCKARIFVYTTSGNDAQQLCRGSPSPVKVFDFSVFKADLNKYIANPRELKLPVPAIYFTFGTNLANLAPFSKPPVSILVRHNQAQQHRDTILKNYNMHSLDLEFSLPDKNDEFLEFFQSQNAQ